MSTVRIGVMLFADSFCVHSQCLAEHTETAHLGQNSGLLGKGGDSCLVDDFGPLLGEFSFFTPEKIV